MAFKDEKVICQELYGTRKSFSALTVNCSVHNKPRELKLVSLELSGNEDSELFYHVCEPNDNAKRPTTPFCADWEWGGGMLGAHIQS